jgi:anhydro-N-acetylmuramic acid kinase
MTEAAMLGIGLMSGTSLDGMDAALVRINGPTDLQFIEFAHRPYRVSERARIESVLAGGPIAEVARLHAALAEWGAEATDAVLAKAHCRADQLAFIAFPGQTVWHEPPTVTYQLGSPAILAERFGVKVVHDFRSRDVAAEGQGAPLVPLIDALCFGATDHARILLNLGGMANATWVGRRSRLDDVRAADTGPGMAIIDALARTVDPNLPFDAGGSLAAQGTVDELVLAELLSDNFFTTPPPRSTGREHFGDAYAARISRRLPGADGVRTAVQLTVESIASFCEQFLPPAEEVLVAGGGARHPVLMDALTKRLAQSGRNLRRFEDQFFSADAKEAVAFALLGWLAIHGQPGNLPAVTGARGLRVLGSISPA